MVYQATLAGRPCVSVLRIRAGESSPYAQAATVSVSDLQERLFGHDRDAVTSYTPSSQQVGDSLLSVCDESKGSEQHEVAS